MPDSRRVQDAGATQPAVVPPHQAPAPEQQGKKKRKRHKKKGGSYGSIMDTMLRGSARSTDELRERQRERIQSSIGGGSFSKLDKI